eukprot:TRINITY_DN24930_c0_g1_i1.p1 TRINITY_DN24930_c0_g1~~TRINITY_DN24930_c0_g1_i1.p1  ORF type:complete len:330 (+),score=53.28 TRINITY_DN24930_c0_g1_i1:48-1037(+)
MSDDKQSALDTLTQKLKELTATEEESRVLPEATLEEFAKHLKGCKNVTVMVGAGISVSAGIPDFRTPGTGLYSQLQKYDLPKPEAIFDLMYFTRKPHPFYRFAKELWPGKHEPTKTHMFLKALSDTGKLKRIYSQNIDNLEREAGLPEKELIEAHGNMIGAHCVDCRKKFEPSFVKESMAANKIPTCSKCRTSEDPILITDEAEAKTSPEDLPYIKGLVKPDIVFFHESLPTEVFASAGDDFKKADALIILGTSLAVSPFNILQTFTSKTCPRLLVTIGADEVAQRAGLTAIDDVVHDCDCDKATSLLAELMELKIDTPKPRSNEEGKL